MYYTLSTNAFTLKDRKDENGKTLQNKECEISVVVLESDLEKGTENPIFYASRYGMIYNPNDDFKPNIPPNHKIKGQLVEDYWSQLPQAREKYKSLLANKSLLSNFNNGGNSGNSEEIAKLQENLFLANNKLIEQNTLIVQLEKQLNEQRSNNNNGSNNMQINQLETMIKILSETMPKTITIEIGEKTTTMKKQVLHDEFETILGYLAEGDAVYLYGSAGTGKSIIGKQVAEALNFDYYPTQAISEEFKVTGYQTANGEYIETSFYKAFKYGGVYMIDEIDASHPDVLVVLNTALANGYFDFPNGRVDAHENFRCIAAGNTAGRGADNEYTGRQQIDLSTLDRFWLVEIDYCKPIEIEIARGNTELVDFAHKIREAATETGISILFSYRAIGRIAKFEEKMNLTKIIKQGLLKGLAQDDVHMLVRNLNMDKSNKYYKALKAAV